MRLLAYLLLLAAVSTFDHSAEGVPGYSLPPPPSAIVAKVMLDRHAGWAIGTAARSYVTLKTADGGCHWFATGPAGFWPRLTREEMSENEAVENNPALSFVSPNVGAVATIAKDEDGNASAIRVAYTAHGGRRWIQTRFRTPDWTESVGIQFADAKHGFILALSGPAAGMMEKRVYRTTDGSRTWHLAADGIGRGSFYPTGMTFRDALHGWIAATYHGEPDVPLYRSSDGGRTWHFQALPEPSVYKDGGYGNTNPPHFFGPQRMEGTLAADYRNNDQNRYETITYVTRDGGQTWRIGRRKQTRSSP